MNEVITREFINSQIEIHQLRDDQVYYYDDLCKRIDMFKNILVSESDGPVSGKRISSMNDKDFTATLADSLAEKVNEKIKKPRRFTIANLGIVLLTVSGWVLSSGFWSTFFSIVFWPWGWYVTVRHFFQMFGVI